MNYSIEVAKILEGALENDMLKVKSYASLLVQNLEKDGDERGARIIRRRLDGSYKNDKNIVVAD